MKVGILHQDLEDHEIFLCDELNKSGIDASLYDLRNSDINELLKNDIMLNRVFASVANRNFKDNILALEILKKLESNGVKCINSYNTTKCDYSKYYATNKMMEAGVRTPKTFLIKDLEEIENALAFSRDCKFPVVVKRDIGGRGKDIHLVKTPEKLTELLISIFEGIKEDNYKGGYIIQEFIKSILDHDVRVSMVNGEIIYSMTRSFVSDDESDEKWIASMSLGSIEGTVELSEEIKNLALNSTKAIGSFFNDVDIMVGERGAYIIENNPTPNFAKRKVKSEKQEIVMRKLVEEIKRDYNEK